jgi:DNA-binding response OmpR family regulator
MFGLKKQKKPRVLIVDDEPGIRETLRERLEFNNIDTIGASDGREGLKAVMANRPDIIITDIAMPVMDGIEMVTAIRNAQIEKHIAIIIVTASKDGKDLVAARNLGVEEYVIKPFEMSELLGKIENLLELSTAATS